MNVLTGINNFLNFLNENWTLIVSIATLAIVVVRKSVAYFEKVVSYFALPEEEQVEIAKIQIRQIMLKLVTEAEFCYEDFMKVGSIKRAQVINQIFVMYPILSQVTNQEEIIAWIDSEIDEALNEMKSIFENSVAESVRPELSE